MSNDPNDLIKWFKTRPLWIQEGARRLHANGTLTPADEKDLAELCKKESLAKAIGTPLTDTVVLADDVFKSSVTTDTIRLNSISEPKGIDELNPRKPLKFDAGSLNIIYGHTGSGKSGYIRILKQVCAARAARKLLGNAFQTTGSPQSCKIGFSINGSNREITWTPSDGALSELSSIEIYDTDSGRVYTNQENEILFEPPVLALFQGLIDVERNVDRVLLTEIGSLPSKRPDIPSQHLKTKAASWYSSVTSATKDSDIDSACRWDKSNQDKLDDLSRRVAETNPAEEARKLRSLKKLTSDYLESLHRQRSSLADESLKKIDDARIIAATKRKAASEDAEKVFAHAPLAGVGGDSWKLLWEQARDYSTKVAYKEEPFPRTTVGARCVLCQQELASDAKERLTSFEKFVKGNLEIEAKAAEDHVDALLRALPVLDSGETNSLKLTALIITYEGAVSLLTAHHSALQSRLEAIKKQIPLPAFPTDEAIKLLGQIIDDLESKAKAYDEASIQTGRDGLQAEAKELSAQKWVSEQKVSIIAERNRLIAIQRLEAARRLLNTKALSDKKTLLTSEIVTEAFIKRFDDELKSLSPSRRLRAEVVKTKTTKGHVWHQIKLSGAQGDAKTGDVLSEGEQRIVSIAAFLAESEGLGANTPFIFDDPISSLDQEFEEATVRRLIDLAKKRQVIVFTHRISLQVLLEALADTEKLEQATISIQREPWGTGEPSAAPFFALRPDKAINQLISERLPRLRKIFTSDGTAAYAPEAKSVCSEIRIIIERLLEHTLLSGVVLRFRRSIQTQQISSISKIKPEDCKMVEAYMTEYSKHEHSQPNETPVVPPTPDKIEADLKFLKEWYSEFTNRPVP